MRARQIAILGALVLVVSAAPAQAQWFVTPYGGANFGGDTVADPKFSFGGGGGFLGNNFGLEVDLGYTPDFFDPDSDDFDLDFDSNLTTLMVNGMVIASRDLNIRPYGSGGVGLMKSHLDDAGDLFDVDNNDFGINLGGGVVGHITDNVGWRTDLRYFRALVDDEPDREFDVGFSDFDAWRGTFGLTFSFGR